MNLPISIQVMKNSRIENERYYRNCEKGKELAKSLFKKYKCSLAEMPVGKMDQQELIILYKAWLQIGYPKESASLIVFGNTYEGSLIK